jgi:hypothetical protein
MERVVLRRGIGEGSNLSLGRLAECLLYYGKTQIILDQGSMSALIGNIDPDILCDLHDDGMIELIYVPQLFARYSEVHGRTSKHSFAYIEMVGRHDGKKYKNSREIITDIIQEKYGTSWSARKGKPSIATHQTEEG